MADSETLWIGNGTLVDYTNATDFLYCVANVAVVVSLWYNEALWAEKR